MVNKETKALKTGDSKSSNMFASIISGGASAVPGGIKSDWEQAQKTGNNEALFAEIREKKALLHEIEELEKAHAPQEMIDEYKKKLGLKTTNGTVKTEMVNAEKIALLQLASETEDPDIKAMILDMAFPEKANDPIARLERIVRSKKDSKPKEETSMNAMLMDMMKYYRERADAPGQSPIETFKEMLEAMNSLNNATGKSGDLNTVAGVLDAKEKLEKLGVISTKQDTIENKRIDLEFEKVKLEHNFRENESKRKSEMEKEQMEIAKEGAEILGKALTKIFDKSGSSEGNKRSSTKQPIFMHCTNPGCKYYTGKEQFEIAKPEDLGPDGKGRDFNCPNDRGGCPNKYKWKGFLNNNAVVESYDENIDPRQKDEAAK